MMQKNWKEENTSPIFSHCNMELSTLHFGCCYAFV